ncbi:hypothetical protein G7062_08050 [Erysipelothrix sp. HDW6C]|uniref:hypothetical protein n=1 Tax=Erysipelothrix sp. HDW6C TaxID=2714930 RepID=UPI00140901A9|nr:hypothetical protein [Erysipelothrix sp. HDW6C]QIK70245.1 hypothetical protein G7062_08050 [Erysipelothrix sp. HDW6C]
MKVRCICGNLMVEEDLKNHEEYSGYKDADYFDLLESNPSTVQELVDRMPRTELYWECKSCNRILFFKKGKIEVYLFEKDIND